MNARNMYIPRITKYTNLDNTDWSTHYITALTIPLDTKTREFKFKFLHDVLVNNFWLRKWSLEENNLCTFCNLMREDILHLFWHCEYVQTFWHDFEEIYGRIIPENTGLTISLVICSSRNPLLCTLILLAKRYIYECRYKNKKPNVRVYKHKVTYMRNTELEIAKKNNTVLKYLEKWQLLLNNDDG